MVKVKVKATYIKLKHIYIGYSSCYIAELMHTYIMLKANEILMG